MGIFNKYMAGVQGAGQEGMNALAMEQFIHKQDRARKLQNILSSSYTPAQDAVPQVGLVQPGQPARTGRMDINNALNAMYAGGFGKEAMDIDMNRAKLSGATPSAVNEYNFWKNLPTKKAQEEFLNVKRARQMLDIGSGYVSPSLTDVTDVTDVAERGLKPVQEPAYISDITGAKKKAEIKAKSQAESELALPQIETSAVELLDLTNKLLEHPGKKYAIGAASVLPIIPGTSQADFDTMLKQIGGKQFMEAYKTLKGGGQITEVEGQKATEAIARMSRSQTQKAFDQGVRDFQSIIKLGLNRARQQTGSYIQKGGKAPQAAIDYLMLNNNPAIRKQFKDKYGYLP